MEGAEPRRETELFQTLANETRLKILLAIARRQRERGPLSYAQIMDEIGVEDSGRFNYHLDQLQGHLIRREDGKYVPSAGTHRLLGLLDSELLYDDTVVDPVTVGAACLRCGDPIEAIYDYDFYVSCHTCEETGRALSGVRWGHRVPAVRRRRAVLSLWVARRDLHDRLFHVFGRYRAALGRTGGAGPS